MKTDPHLTGKSWPLVTFAIALVIFAAFFRLLRIDALPSAPNFSPLMAIAVCAALVLPGWLAFSVPLSALILSDLLLNAHYGVALFGFEELARYACYGLAVACGLGLRRRGSGLGLTLGAVVANSLLFYVVTNTTSWFGSPAYAQTAAGWGQALTIGVPGFPPTWTFFRTSLVSDLLFAGVFLAAIHLVARPRVAALAPVRA